MRILDKVKAHHKEEHDAIEDALDTQKLRVSIERRIHNLETLVREEAPDSHLKHVALGQIRNTRLALEKMLNDMDEGNVAEE